MTTQATALATRPGAELDQLLAAASDAAPALRATRPDDRARMLRSVAEALESAAEELVPLAAEETNLAHARLTGELKRTTFQLRLFAEVVEEGSYLEAMIDHADAEWGMGPRPDLRRMLVPLGPVLVFAASNFPFAFSVAGGDTASALAAGCPVIVKGHSGHPRLSQLCAELVREGLTAAGAPDGAFALVSGTETGVEALRDQRVKAASFTGSVPVGRRLHDIAATRPTPIPFYGELGSLNPAFVTRRAVAARGEHIAHGFVASYTLGAGQFCTKPGFLFLPEGHGLDAALVDASRAVEGARLLNDRITEGYAGAIEALTAIDGVEVLVAPRRTTDGVVTPTLVRTTAATLAERADELLEERFGPATVVVEWADGDDLLAAAELFEGNLTATIHAEDDDAQALAPLLALLEERAGRLVWNGWPTGVSVTWAMHHGGPWPATTASIHTSVGTTAVRRYLRPVSYQDTPHALLPEELRDDNPLGLPRRVDGVLRLAAGGA
jgi:NADP-dependent aldehyde dehydrogenase